MRQRPDYKLTWNSNTQSFVTAIHEARVAELVAESRWNAAKLSAALRVEFGYWISYSFAFGPLYGLKGARWASATAEQRARVDANVFGALCKARDIVDARLGRWLPSVETAVRSGQGLAQVSAELVAEELRENGHDDCWFADVVQTLNLCFQALRRDVPEEEIERIAERSFSSWIAPQKDAVLRFADELAALNMRSQFFAGYGSGSDSDSDA